MDARKNLEAIYKAAINAVNPEVAVRTHLTLEGDKLVLLADGNPLKEYDISRYERIFVVGAGKATSPMAKAVEGILGNRISSGCVCVKYGYTEELSKIEIVEASHPIPDANGVEGAKKIRAILEDAGEKDLVISLISGGGSALLPLPPEPITLDEKRETTDLLLKSGAAINEINALRKHLSLVKGGNMAKAAHPATVINLMISDVVGDHMDVIASGPFVPDNSTFALAQGIIEKYGLSGKVPASVASHIKAGVEGGIEENPGKESDIFGNITNLIIASNIIALKAAKKEAEQQGYSTIILSSLIEGDTKDAACWHSRIAQEIRASSNPTTRPACVISGGETTVMVTGEGLGGRNMEFGIQAACCIEGIPGITMASVGTDGSDGPTDAAGAVADGDTIRKAKEKGLDIEQYIAKNDSYHFFEEIGDLIITGPTNTNVMDVRIVLVE
ncbi:MAG: glycerate kinase [bacterium]|nr:glycerate kinase [bacterium]